LRTDIALLFLLSCLHAFATHNRAGEITYEHLSGYTYEITLLTYTYTPSAANEDRDVLLIDWGDDMYSEISRVDIELLPDDYQKNTYVGIHQYPGPGNYYIVMEDKNRNQGIDNITESVYIPFAVKTKLTIPAIGDQNSTPKLLNPPIDKAVVGQLFVHNPTAFDVEGDSLSYALTVCSGSGGKPIESYTFPVASNVFYVDSLSGDLVWDTPVNKGRFNVAMVVTEFRDGVQISAIVRDIQIDVEEADNHPPVIESLGPVCVKAGEMVSFTVTATDEDNDSIKLSAVGGPFEVQPSPSVFPSVYGRGRVQSDFLWDTKCGHIRRRPYTVLFKAEDFADVPLTAQFPVDIQVVGHPQQIRKADAKYDEVLLSLDAPKCENSGRLMIYRSSRSVQLAEECIPEMPSNYVLVADTVAGVSSFLDDGWTGGLSQGYSYCYRTVILFDNGAKSYPSDEVCVSLSVHSPLLTNVSVESENNDSAFVLVRWTAPWGIDESQYPAPYSVDLFRIGCDGDEETLLATYGDFSDTSYVDTVVADNFSAFCYRLQWYAEGTGEKVAVGHPVSAQTVQISAVGMDNCIELNVGAVVPWENDVFRIYRLSSDEKTWDYLGETYSSVFLDSSVVNGANYCYRAESVGRYTLPGFPSDLHNFSNAVCTAPIDSFPPETLEISIEQNCADYTNSVVWDVDGKSGEDSNDSVAVYYKECKDRSDYALLASVPAMSGSFVHSFVDSSVTMGGCYMALSYDDAGNVSDTSNVECVYSCPGYSLPNVFTPDGDGVNDYWEPISNKFVESIDLTVYNIWGDAVFSTRDPSIMWNGANGTTKAILPDGMFYYICDVYELWLNCNSQPRTLVGFVYKFSNGQKLPELKK